MTAIFRVLIYAVAAGPFFTANIAPGPSSVREKGIGSPDPRDRRVEWIFIFIRTFDLEWNVKRYYNTVDIAVQVVKIKVEGGNDDEREDVRRRTCYHLNPMDHLSQTKLLHPDSVAFPFL